MAKVDVLVPGHLPAKTDATLDDEFAVHRIAEPAELAGVAADSLRKFRGIARGAHVGIGRDLIERLTGLEIIANFGVGYDGIDLKAAAERNIVVTNTPDVLTEEVADTALGLILMTVRELSAAERYLRAGEWARKGNYPLTATLRQRTVGILGLGRIGMAIARRLDAMQVTVVYHTRKARNDVAYRYFADLRSMAEAVDVLLVVVPGTPETRNIVNADILAALGPDGFLINIGRGTVVDEKALIQTLKARTIRAAGLDVFLDEPNVPAELIALDNVVLLPHVGSGSVHTRDAMGQLMIDNLKNWFEKGAPLTPVPETPWRPRQKQQA